MKHLRGGSSAASGATVSEVRQRYSGLPSRCCCPILKGIGAFGRVLTPALPINTRAVARVLHRKVASICNTRPARCSFQAGTSGPAAPRATATALTGMSVESATCLAAQ